MCEPLSCLAHGWDRVSPVSVGQRILILGAGIIGNLWAAALHLQGHKKVTMSEPLEARRKLFENLGTIHYNKFSLIRKKKTHNRGNIFQVQTTDASLRQN